MLAGLKDRGTSGLLDLTVRLDLRGNKVGTAGALALAALKDARAYVAYEVNL